MKYNDLASVLKTKMVSRPEEAWEFVQERAQRGVDDSLVAEVFDVYRTRFPESIVTTDGVLIPAVARNFKALGCPIETLRHSTDGVIRATVELQGRTFILYQNDEQVVGVISLYVENRLAKMTGLAHAVYRKVVTRFLKKSV